MEGRMSYDTWKATDPAERNRDPDLTEEEQIFDDLVNDLISANEAERLLDELRRSAR
jgi:hypothetical protein